MALHGDMDQSARTAALESFRNGEVTLLIASDVAARGLDIPDVSHVFNFDVPHHPDDYVHRIGRTGRAGKSGTAITIVAPADGKAVVAIEKLIGQSIPWVGDAGCRRNRGTSAHREQRRAPRAAAAARHRGEHHRRPHGEAKRPRGQHGEPKRPQSQHNSQPRPRAAAAPGRSRAKSSRGGRGQRREPPCRPSCCARCRPKPEQNRVKSRCGSN